MGHTKEQVEAAVKAKGYVWFEDVNNKGYDVNIVGIRNSSTGDKVTNLFDDLLTISYKENGEWKFHSWPAEQRGLNNLVINLELLDLLKVNTEVLTLLDYMEENTKL